MRQFKVLKITFLLFFSLVSSCLSAQARYIFSPVKELGIKEVPSPKNLSIPLEVSYYNDGTATMRCGQIPSSYFHPISRAFYTGFYKGVLWVELSFPDTQADDGKNFYLDLGNEHIDMAELFIKKDGDWQFYGRTGRSVRRKYMSMPSWRLVIPLDESELPEEDVHTVRVRMVSYIGAPVGFTLQPFRNYGYTNRIFSTFNLGLTVISLALLVFILVVGIFFHDSSYILLGITASLQFLLMLHAKGVGQIYLWNFIAVIPHSPRFLYLLTFAELSMTAVTFRSLVGEGMETKSFRWELGGIIATGAVASLLVLVAYSPALAFAIYSSAIIAMCLGLVFMWISSLKKTHADIFYVTYWWIPMLILFIYIGFSNLYRFSVTIPRNTLVLNRDLFLYDFILLSMCIPAARVTVTRTRSRIDALRRELEYRGETLDSIRKERNLFFAVTSHLLELSNTITNALRLPQMRSPVDEVQKIMGLVERLSCQSNDYLTAMIAFEKNSRPEISRIMLRSFCASCVDSAGLIASRKKIKMKYKSRVRDNVIVLANQSLLEIIFTNSLHTAIRYSMDGSRMDVELTESDGFVCMRISCKTDSGVHGKIAGLLDDDFPDPDDDADDSNELSFRLVRKILGLYDGNLSAEDTGDGFVITISFRTESPFGRVVHNPAVSTKFETEPNKEITNSDWETTIADDVFSVDGKLPVIVLAEENMSVVKFMEGLLHGHCMLYSMSSGADVWNFLQSGARKPDIIICNYTLPVISGMELFRKCSDVQDLQDIPFIFLLPVSEGARQSEFIRRGAAACLVPPFTKDELFKAIYTIFSLSRKIRRTLLARVDMALYGDVPMMHEEKVSVKEEPVMVPSNTKFISLTDAQRQIFTDDGLSSREQQIAMMISRGLSDKEIADDLSISPGTVVTHKKNIFKKLDVHSRVELMAKVR